MISPERTKEIFLALKLHFTGSYDYVKYGGRIRAQLKPNEQWAVGRIAKKFREEEKVRDFFVANMIEDYIRDGKINGFVNTYSTKDAVAVYDQWAAWWNAYAYQFKADIGKFESIKEMIEIRDGDHPKVFQQFIEGKVHFNTLACLMMGLKTLPDYWSKCDDTILFGEYLKILKKYCSLIDKNRKKINEIIKGSA